uniref:Prostate transmembrane protein, androgen induced 1 n=1 Tax=Poecilia reticulata TaxID=8081 RepID=A0A3P9P0G1_POERE
MLNLMGVLNATAPNVSCTCNCKPYTSIQNMEITQLEFVQILVIVVFMMVMVVVITCLLNHYRLSARSLLSRHSPARRRHLPLANEGSLWSSDSTGTSSGLNEVTSVWNKLLVLQLKASKHLDVSRRAAPGVQPAAPGQRSHVVPAARPAAQPAAASASITALPAGVRPETLPADVPLPAPEPHRPPAHHLPLRRRGAASLPGALHSAAEGPRTADGAEPRVGSPSAQPNSV